MDDADFYYYIEGRLPARTKRLIERHLLRCDGCREKLSLMVDNFPTDLGEPYEIASRILYSNKTLFGMLRRKCKY